MRNPKKLVIACLMLALVGTPARGGEGDEVTVESLLNTIRANKRALVSVNLPLTEGEATKFWPVYERYQKELNEVQDRLAKIIQDYTTRFRTLSDADAAKLANDYLTVEADRAKVRQSYLAPLSEALPGRKVVRFYQIENKMDAVLRYDLAAAIPVIEE